jgi:hypothetical protein
MFLKPQSYITIQKTAMQRKIELNINLKTTKRLTKAKIMDSKNTNYFQNFNLSEISVCPAINGIL